MADFSVNPNSLKVYSSDFENIAKKIENINSSSKTTLNNLKRYMSSSQSINVNGWTNTLTIATFNSRKIGSVLSTIADEYIKHENTVSGKSFNKITTQIKNFTDKLNVGGGGVRKADVKSKSKNSGTGKKILDTIIGKAGLGGSIISSVVGLVDSVKTGNIGGVAKGTKNFINGVYNFIRNSEKLEKLSRMNPGQAKITGFKRFFGLNKAFTGSLKPSVASSFSTRFYNNFSKQMSDRLGAYTAKGAKSIFAWAGVAASAVGNGIQNYNEAKSGKISASRAVMETITETAIDVGTGIVVGAAVSAAVAAVGWVSAPVIAVGAITAGVIAGSDAICKWATKKITGESKGLTETISDAVLDLGEATVKAGKKIVSGVGSLFKKIF